MCKELRPRVSVIKKICDVGDGFIILEDHVGYKPGTSNVYKVDKNLNFLWESDPLPEPYEIGFYSDVGIRGGVLSIWDCASGRGSLDSKTGKISNWTFAPWG